MTVSSCIWHKGIEVNIRNPWPSGTDTVPRLTKEQRGLHQEHKSSYLTCLGESPLHYCWELGDMQIPRMGVKKMQLNRDMIYKEIWSWKDLGQSTCLGSHEANLEVHIWPSLTPQNAARDLFQIKLSLMTKSSSDTWLILTKNQNQDIHKLYLEGSGLERVQNACPRPKAVEVKTCSVREC